MTDFGWTLFNNFINDLFFSYKASVLKVSRRKRGTLTRLGFAHSHFAHSFIFRLLDYAEARMRKKNVDAQQGEEVAGGTNLVPSQGVYRKASK